MSREKVMKFSDLVFFLILNGLASSVLGEFECKITNRLSSAVNGGGCVIPLRKRVFQLHFLQHIIRINFLLI